MKKLALRKTTIRNLTDLTSIIGGISNGCATNTLVRCIDTNEATNCGPNCPATGLGCTNTCPQATFGC